ncbi:MAG TPA: PmoA family protein, partial [Nitrospiraceae bacterium]|nr:PmoA family protein [Nitrospiraceae bacterium]
MKKILLTLVLAWISTSYLVAQQESVTFRQGDQKVEVSVGGQPFADYHTSPDLPKPFFSPVHGADGTILSRPLENPEDHKHHKGIWLSIDEVNAIKFWAEDGKIVNQSAGFADSQKDSPGTMTIVNHWMGTNGEPLLIETTKLSIFPNRLMIYDISLAAAKEPVTFGDTKEGLFGFRMVNSLREKETGKVVNADGLQGTKECWGKPSAWVDYYGEVDGKIFGVTLMDHPGNFRPSRYHVRDYGLFSMSPFGESSYTGGASEAAPLTLKPGESVQL